MADLSSILAGTDDPCQTPDEVARRRQQGAALFAQGTSVAPLQHWTQALARAAQGGLGGYELGQARDQEQAGKAAANSALVGALTGNQSPNDIAATALKNPWTRDFGQNLAARSIAQKMQQDSPAARLDLERKQLDIDQLKQTQPLNLDLLRAQTDAAKRKDAMDQYFIDLMNGGGSKGGPATSGGVQPQSFQGQGLPTSPAQKISDVTTTDPNLIQAQTAQNQTAPAQKSPRDILAGRSEAERLQFMMTYKKDPAKAAEMLEKWANPQTMSKPAQHDIDKAEIGFTNLLGAFNEIQRLYDPKYLQGSPKIQYAINNIRDKWTPETWKNLQLTPGEAEDLRKYEQFAATSMNNLNTRLKELSGTAVTESEMNRILRELPSPGTGPFSGDGPTAFKAKLDQGMRLAKMGIARQRYLRANNFSGDVNAAANSIPLEEMPKVIQRRGDAIQKIIEETNPGAPPDAIKASVRQQLVKEFGESI
jgi:hypothetical protein